VAPPGLSAMRLADSKRRAGRGRRAQPPDRKGQWIPRGPPKWRRSPTRLC